MSDRNFFIITSSLESSENIATQTISLGSLSGEKVTRSGANGKDSTVYGIRYLEQIKIRKSMIHFPISRFPVVQFYRD